LTKQLGPLRIRRGIKPHACVVAKTPRAGVKAKALNAAARSLPRGELGHQSREALGDSQVRF
jgi:hypothetical protein